MNEISVKHNLSEHDQRQNDRIDALERGQREILELLRPISETYKTASVLGKWTMALLVLISITLGIILSVRSILHK